MSNAFRALASILLVFSFGAARAGIEWEVEHRFPLFDDKSDFTAVVQSWPVQAGGSFAPVTEFAIRPGFTAWLRDHLRPDRTAWNYKQQTYDKRKLFASQHLIVARLSAPEGGSNCTWSRDGVSTQSRPCEEPFTFTISTAETSHGATADASVPFTLSVEAIAPSGAVYRERLEQQRIEVELIVAVGDSFASGEGNPDWPTQFKPKKKANVAWFVDSTQTAHTWIAKGSVWWDEPCHRSLLSWPALFALDRAVRDPHRVVQFASFACSGAEIYDGFFRAQMNPPGMGYDVQLKNTNQSSRRDGGAGFGAPQNVAGGEGDFLFNVRSPQPGRHFLRYSQHNALARLLCARTVVRSWTYTAHIVDGPRTDQTYYGPVQLAGCDTLERTPKFVLVSFGGNDFGFGGVVADQITPKEVRQGPFSGFRKFFWNVARNSVAPIDYRKARAAVDAELATLYGQLASSFTALHIKPETVVLAIYPDPTGDEKNRLACRAFTQEGNAPLSWVLAEGIAEKVGYKKTGVPFGLNPQRLKDLQEGFVLPLRGRQKEQAAKLQWRTVDSNIGVRVGKQDHGICAISDTCTEKSCPVGDRVSHWPESDSRYTKYPRLKYVHEYDPYDPTRTRGFRLAMDAVLTNAKPQSKSQGAIVHPNWLSGNVHPTLSVHARIAAALASCTATNCGTP